MNCSMKSKTEQSKSNKINCFLSKRKKKKDLKIIMRCMKMINELFLKCVFLLHQFSVLNGNGVQELG